MIHHAFMAHPVRGDVEANLERAKGWYKWLCEAYPRRIFHATWIIDCEMFGDANPAYRNRGIEQNKRIIELCDEFWTVGPRITKGMNEELEHAKLHKKKIVDFTHRNLVNPPLRL